MAERGHLASLRQLAGLAELLRERELARLAEATARVAGTRSAISALAGEVHQRSAALARMGPQAGRGADGAQPAAEVDAALMAGADAAWLRRVSTRRAALQSQLLAQLARREDARANAARAFGRADVLQRLSDSARCDAITARARRADRGS